MTNLNHHRNESSTRPVPAKTNTAPQTAAMTLAALLGVSPAMASAVRPVSLRTTEASTSEDGEWRVPEETPAIAMIPAAIDQLDNGSQDLVDAVAFATIVARALPVDHEADAAADRAVAKLAATRKKRKLTKK